MGIGRQNLILKRESTKPGFFVCDNDNCVII